MTSLELIDSILTLEEGYRTIFYPHTQELFIIHPDDAPLYIVRLKDYSYVKHVDMDNNNCVVLENLVNEYAMTPIEERGLEELYMDQGGKRGKNY